jgi:hypothetical protein
MLSRISETMYTPTVAPIALAAVSVRVEHNEYEKLPVDGRRATGRSNNVRSA